MRALRHLSSATGPCGLVNPRETRALPVQVASVEDLLLTPREREVTALVVSGLSNKQVGSELGISEITVKAHRGQVMRKMNAESLPDLVTMAADLCLRPGLKH